MNAWKPYLWRLLFTVLGLITAILFIVLGFGKTVLILLCCGVGFTLGSYKDNGKGIRVPEWLWFWRDRW